MNQPANENPFSPKQALVPTPELYDELTADAMEQLARATVAEMTPIGPGSVVHDNGCGTGNGTAAVVEVLGPELARQISIKGSDNNDAALDLYRKKAKEQGWPAEATNVDCDHLNWSDDTFSHSLNTALVFALPNDAIDAIKETYRTLKPGGVAGFNCWGYVPNMGPIHAASRATRPEGTPVPRQGMDKWDDINFLKQVVEKGGFETAKMKVLQKDVYITTGDKHRYLSMLWSFIGGTSSVGWLESDEERWDEALRMIGEELRKTDGYAEVEGNRLRLKFVANIVVATK